MARPRKQIDPKAVFELARIGCTMEEMASVLGCDATTIGRRFRGEVEQGQAEMRVSLRRQQLEVASKGNVAMLIWLGKQLLGQSDKGRAESAGEVDKAIMTRLSQLSVEEQNEQFRKLLLKVGCSLETPSQGPDGDSSLGTRNTETQA